VVKPDLLREAVEALRGYQDVITMGEFREAQSKAAPIIRRYDALSAPKGESHE
jgi:hypothetical protein